VFLIPWTRRRQGRGFRGDGRPGMVRPAFRAQGTARSFSTSFTAWQPPPWST